MAAVNKKNNKKNKSSLNTKKVIVNSNKISDDHPAPVDSDVTMSMNLKIFTTKP